MIWFKFKRISSESMGVVLAELPPITKAPKRYAKYDVIGRDGAEYIDQGYTSYQKQLSIGIKDVSRINEIMDWLNGSGTLIISNEPDKYYLAKVLDQVDYSNLVRFRQAIVPFEVQPYKYAVDNDIITITDASYTINNDANASCMPTLTIYGSGNVSILLDGVTIFTLSSIPSAITVNGMAHETFYGETSYNRKKTGDYLVIPPGEHTLSWTGNVTKVEMVVNKRWL
jgi:predicted phage tail component-like protein